MNLMHYLRWILIAVLSMLASTGYAAIPDVNAEGVGAPSYPYFYDIGETVKIKKNGKGDNVYWTLTGTGSKASFWGSDTSSVALGSGKVRYQANFNAAGELITSIGTGKGKSKTLQNYLEIKGSLPATNWGRTSWGKLKNQLLLKANLTEVGTSGASALGFKTVFTGGWAPSIPGLTGGSTGENLWLSGLSTGSYLLVNAFQSGNLNLLGKSLTIKGVSSVASVPLPGAVWLFGAGLIALFANRRNSATDSLRLAV